MDSMQNSETTLEQVIPPETRYQASGTELVTRAKALVITTDEEYQAAAEFLNAVSALRKAIKAEYDPLADAANVTHKKITSRRAELLANPDNAERIAKGTISAYLNEQRVKREKQAAEAQSMLRKQEEDRRLAEAESMHKAGFKAEAEAILDAPVTVAPVTIAAPKAAGVSSRVVLKYRIIDPLKIKRPYLCPDEGVIAAQVKALGKEAVALVGEGSIEVYEDTVIASRGGR